MQTAGTADHRITIEPAPGRVRARLNDGIIADSKAALVLREADYPPVYYFPADDVERGYLGQTELTTHCPHKGDASYWTITRHTDIVENGVWSYQNPKPEVREIAGMLAFDTRKGIEVYEVDPTDA